uniref:Uncharacterized protein n=1 Tax=Romanomermis culicivorax TaxID=13658 RepID=A0A915JYD2_ROMCU
MQSSIKTKENSPYNVLNGQASHPEVPQSCLNANYGGVTHHPLQKKSKSTWTAWSAWSPCSATCGAGFKSRTRQCYDVKSYRKTKYCDGIEAEKQSCSDKECSFLSTSNMRKRYSTSTADWFKKGATPI